MSGQARFCSDFHRAVELIGKRWSGAILREMLGGSRRYSELRSAIPDISDRMLCARLKGLEDEGIVARRVYAETPVRVEYELTDKGRALQKVFDTIDEWAERWGDCCRASGDGPEAA